MPDYDAAPVASDPRAVELAALFDTALAATPANERLFQQAFSHLYEWALHTLTLPRLADSPTARELAQGAMIALYKKSQRELLKGPDFTRIVYTHLLGSKKARIRGALDKFLKGQQRSSLHFESLDAARSPDAGPSLKDLLAAAAPAPAERTIILNTKKRETAFLLFGLKAEIGELKQKAKYAPKVETLEAFRNYISTKIDGLLDEELLHLQICILSVGRSQRLLDPELSDYLQKKLNLDQNAVRQRVNRHILKSPTVLDLLEDRRDDN